MKVRALKPLLDALPADGLPAPLMGWLRHRALQLQALHLAGGDAEALRAASGSPIFAPHPLDPQVSFDADASVRLRAQLPAAPVESLGQLHERLLGLELHRGPQGWKLTGGSGRRQRGSHYTPTALAESVVARAAALRPAPARILDPAMGGGVFLVQAVRQLGSAIVDGLEGIDSDPVAVAVARLSLWLALRPGCTVDQLLGDRLRCADALLEDDPGGRFDLVLGNPPYIPFYGRGSQARRFPAGYRDAIVARHRTIDGDAVVQGRVNTFLLFCALATERLAPGGCAAMVLPDTVLTNASYAGLRRVLSASGRLREAIRYTQSMFAGASVGTAVVLWGEPREAGTAALWSAGEAAPTTVEPTQDLLERANVSWFPLSTAEMRRRMLPVRGMVPLGAVALVRDGLNTGSRRMRERLLCTEPDGDPTLRRCVEGSNIQPLRLSDGALWVRYNPALLSGGREGASLGSRAVFDAHKILYRQTASHPIAAVDTRGLCYRNSVHGVVLNEPNETVLWALCAYLNSQAVKQHHQTISGEVRRAFPQVHVATMKMLPVPAALLDPQHALATALEAAGRAGDLDAVDAALSDWLATLRSADV